MAWGSSSIHQKNLFYLPSTPKHRIFSLLVFKVQYFFSFFNFWSKYPTLSYQWSKIGVFIFYFDFLWSTDSIENLPKLVEDIVRTSINTGPRGPLRLAQGIQAVVGVGGEWLADVSKVFFFFGRSLINFRLWFIWVSGHCLTMKLNLSIWILWSKLQSTNSSTGLPTQLQLGLFSPVYLRKLFERMGATYIKLGQVSLYFSFWFSFVCWYSL